METGYAVIGGLVLLVLVLASRSVNQNVYVSGGGHAKKESSTSLVPILIIGGLIVLGVLVASVALPALQQAAANAGQAEIIKAQGLADATRMRAAADAEVKLSLARSIPMLVSGLLLVLAVAILTPISYFFIVKYQQAQDRRPIAAPYRILVSSGNPIEHALPEGDHVLELGEAKEYVPMQQKRLAPVEAQYDRR